MSAIVQAALGGPRTGEGDAPRTRRASILLAIIAVVLASAYAAAIVATEGQPMLLAPIAGALIGVLVWTRPVHGVYLLFGAALLFEQTDVPGVAPLTDQSHIWQRLDAYSAIPLPLSLADLLVLLTLTTLLAHRAAGWHGPLRIGPFGWAVGAYGAIFALGIVFGITRDAPWSLGAALAELRAPLHMCLLYLLAVNLVRDRAQFMFLAWMFVALVGVKALQAIGSYVAGMGRSFALEAVTGHEDVVFFNLAIALLAVLVLSRERTKLTYALLAVLPLVVLAELFTQRRVAFIALGAAVIVVTLLALAIDRRRALAFALLGTLAVAAYVPLFWDEGGALGEPIRAVRAALDSDQVSAKDDLSDHWRQIESRNIEFTLRELPLTGVGVGQQYLFHEEPPKVPYPYWRYWTHNALLWLWLKAGPLGGFALWLLVARILLVASSRFASLRDRQLRWMVALPVLLVTIQVTFSSIDMGLTHSRTMVVFGTVLGAAASLLAPVRANERQGAA